MAIYQSTAVAKVYGNYGYLVAIVSFISMPILPRAKYLQTLLLNLLAVCLAAAFGLLGVWSSVSRLQLHPLTMFSDIEAKVQARIHTTKPGSREVYNASQSAVCGVWLFFLIYMANTLRAMFPALQLPAILFSIFTNVMFVYGVRQPTTASAEKFVKTILEAFLTALGLSFGVSMLVIPVSCRLVAFKEQAGCLQAMRGTLKAQTTFLQSLETSTNGQQGARKGTTHQTHGHGTNSEAKAADLHHRQSPQATALQAAISKLRQLFGKMHGDLPFAKRETAWGKLDANDLEDVFNHLRRIMIPLVGMSTITDCYERITARRDFDREDGAEARTPAEDEVYREETELWNKIMDALHEPFAAYTAAMDEGLQHIGLALELLPKPKPKASAVDIEEGISLRPGQPGFTKYMEQKQDEYCATRGEALRVWARAKGFPEDQFDRNRPHSIPTQDSMSVQHRKDRSQLYLILYMEYLVSRSLFSYCIRL